MESICGLRLGGSRSERPNAKRGARWWQGALVVAVLATVSTASPQGSTDLRYGGPTTWDVTGPVGGPFSSTSFSVVLGNRSHQDLRWSVPSVPSFVDVTPDNGVLQPHVRDSVQVDLDRAFAQGLPAGLYSETLTFHNDTTSEPDFNVVCNLTVTAVPPSSVLVPLTDFVTQGPASGPFAPDNQTYTLTNTGPASLDWQANASDAWLSVAPSSGQLAPGGTVNVNVAINDPATAGLSNGLHQSVVEWRESTSHAVLHSRNVNLNILAGSGAGWTVFTPSADTRTIFVSSSTGNDANDGLSQATPKRTILGGASLVRNNYPDWLLFKCGDTFSGSIVDGAVTGYWVKRGRSATEPILISSYGAGERPIIASGSVDGFRTWNQLYQGQYAGNLAIVGLDFYANTYGGGSENPRGIWLLGGGANTLVENCYVRGYCGNIVIGSNGHGAAGILQNVAIRRNVVVDAYTIVSGGGAQGLYASDANGLLIEENVFDHNGWVDSISGSGPNWYRRNVYLQNGSTGVVFRGNIVSGTDGLQQRPGGICENNLFLRNALALQFGSGNEPEPAGVSGTIHGNVILDGRDLQSGSPRGWGLIIGNTVNTTVDQNVVAHNVSGTAPNPWVLNFDNGHGNPNGMQNVVFDHNVVCDWGSTGRDAQVASYQSNIIHNILLTNNDIQDVVDATYLLSMTSTTPNLLSELHGANNRWYRQSGNAGQMFKVAGVDMTFTAFKNGINDTTSTFGPISYPDQNRTIGSYHASIGGAATLDAFMAEARLQSKTNWRVQYTADAVNDYVRAGFGMAPLGFMP